MKNFVDDCPGSRMDTVWAFRQDMLGLGFLANTSSSSAR